MSRLRQRRYEAPADAAVSPLSPPRDRRSGESPKHPNTLLSTHRSPTPCGLTAPPEPRVLRLFLPSSLPRGPMDRGRARPLRSWRDLPSNPLIGLAGEPVKREEYRFYCDPCQKGFFTQDRYDRHMTEHIWCTFAGCKFTCRKGKEWKMEMHVETLHNRPDAPNLADVGTYLSQRRHRFPTQDTVKAKVEELFYKAARGVTLPDERRRWMRQHGVIVRKHPRTEETYIATDALRPTRAGKGENPPTQKRRQEQSEEPIPSTEDNAKTPTCAVEAEVPIAAEAVMDHGADEGPTSGRPPSKESPTHAAGHPLSSLPPSRPKRIVPLGPNGTLTRSQQVQLIRDRYRDAATVPRFYVCHRCGAKGTHWVDECPHRGEETFERRMVWGEERQQPRNRGKTEESAGKDEKGVKVEKESNTRADASEQEAEAEVVNEAEEEEDCALEVEREDENGEENPKHVECVEEDVHHGASDNDGPPEEQSARRDATNGSVRDVTHIIAPAAARNRRQQQQQQQQQQRCKHRGIRPHPAPPPQTLFDRLVEDGKVNEEGLLLQAFRFFVMRRFFEPCHTEPNKLS